MATPSPTTVDDDSRSRFLAVVAEQPLAGAEHDREDHEPKLVDEVVLDQRLHEPGAAVHDDVAVLLLLQLRDLIDQVAGEHSRVGPLRVTQRRRHDVLRHGVELIGELPVALGPSRREALVGPPAEQQRGGAHRLVQLELVALLTTVDLEGPPTVLVVLPATRCLDDPVERDELGHDYPAHDVLLGATQCWYDQRARENSSAPGTGSIPEAGSGPTGSSTRRRPRAAEAVLRYRGRVR